MFTKETWRRTYRTFLQAFLGSIMTDGILLIAGLDFADTPKAIVTFVLSNIVAPSIAAGWAAVMNLEKEDEYNG